MDGEVGVEYGSQQKSPEAPRHFQLQPSDSWIENLRSTSTSESITEKCEPNVLQSITIPTHLTKVHRGVCACGGVCVAN